MSAGANGLSQDEAFARIRLLRSPNVGPVSYFQLLRRFGTAGAALVAMPDLAARRGGKYRVVPEAVVEQEVVALRRAGGRYMFHDSPDYPALLREMDSPPPILTVRGRAELLNHPAVAIVGARNASAGAVKLARDFAVALSAAGYAVVSGLARGVDAGAHRGALSGEGGTIGVIASGIDVTYPSEHFDLQEDIARNGLLVAEQPPGTQPLARHFPFRNRIIAGLAMGTLVVEAAPRSGSLITARLAGEAGREVMAIPGSPLDSRAQGCNQLIRDGAVLVQSPQDVLELVQSFDGTPRLRLREVGDEADFAASVEEAFLPDDGLNESDLRQIDALLGMAPVSIDELIRQSGQRPAAVHGALLELELAGLLCRHAAGRVSLLHYGEGSA